MFVGLVYSATEAPLNQECLKSLKYRVIDILYLLNYLFLFHPSFSLPYREIRSLARLPRAFWDVVFSS